MAEPHRETATILLVDDHPLMRKGLRTLLEGEPGFEVVGEAGDGEEAFQLAKALLPDVVVMDVTMPTLSGIDATARILSEVAGTRVVTLSMHAEKRFVDAMLKAGAAAYVLKDSAPEELVRAIHAALNGQCFLSAPILGTVVSGYRESVGGGRASGGDGHLSGRLPVLLQAKLHRPVLPADFVRRANVLERLDAGRSLPLTLVSAPAGYGKSLSIASWLEHADSTSAWLVLDHEDGDLRQFVMYLVAAVRRVLPRACEETLGLTSEPELPPVATVAATLCNDLDELDGSVVLVLDDYHHIASGSPVNELLQQVLARPPVPLHLVIITRRDPPLPLYLLRSRGQVNEIRMRDLRFDAAETRALLEATVGFRVSDAAVARLEEELEGWVAGLRLVALASRRDQDPSAVLEHLRGGVQHAQQYLIHEVVSRQSPRVRDWLLKSAILDRFCASLCAAVSADPDDAGAEPLNGESFIRTVVDENLFARPLDTEGEWFRYHQLFQDLLLAELRRVHGPDRMAVLHRHASEWFERENLLDEAVKHALAARDPERLAQVVERRAREVLREGRIEVLARWLSHLPHDVVQKRPLLLCADAWRQYFRTDGTGLQATLDRLEDLAGGVGDVQVLSADIAALRAWCALQQNDAALASNYSERVLALRGVGPQEPCRSLAELVFGLAGQMQGQREGVARSLMASMLDSSLPDPHGEIRLARTLALISYIAADPPGAGAGLERARKVASMSGVATPSPWNDYLDALFHLQRGEAGRALPMLENVTRGRSEHTRAIVDAMCAQVLAHQADGQPEQAAAALESLEGLTREGHPSFVLLAEACAVRLALMQGHSEAAAAWLRTSSAPPSGAMLWWFEVPSVTWCRAAIAEGSPEHLREAERRLREHAAVSQASHNTCQAIPILGLLAVACDRLGKRDEACSILGTALKLASPGGFVFPFHEVGRPMADLLQSFEGEYEDFIEQVLGAFPASAPAAPPAVAALGALTAAPRVQPGPGGARPGADELTNRELDIVELLAERLQNKEIADRLSIAPQTVNYHLKHIYDKLGVQSRRQAVRRALDLGLLGPRSSA